MIRYLLVFLLITSNLYTEENYKVSKIINFDNKNKEIQTEYYSYNTYLNMIVWKRKYTEAYGNGEQTKIYSYDKDNRLILEKTVGDEIYYSYEYATEKGNKIVTQIEHIRRNDKTIEEWDKIITIYNNKNQLLSSEQISRAAFHSKKLYKYENSTDRLIQTVEESGGGGVKNKIITEYEYDKLGNIVKIESNTTGSYENKEVTICNYTITGNKRFLNRKSILSSKDIDSKVYNSEYNSEEIKHNDKWLLINEKLVDELFDGRENFSKVYHYDDNYRLQTIEVKNKNGYPSLIKYYYSEIIDVANISSTSYLVYNKNIYMYHPVKIIDSTATTAWLEGVKGPGIGEEIEITFDKPIFIDKISVLPGYFDVKWYKDNNRLKKVQIEVNNKKYIVNFDDKMEEQFYTLSNKQKTKNIKIKIMEVYKSPVWDDSAISEINIFYNESQYLYNLSKLNNYLQVISN